MMSKKIQLAQRERSYTKILFAYSGWCEDNIIFYYRGQYQSGTIYSKTTEKALLNLYEDIVDEQYN